jgi:hypothetical protein
MRDGRAAPHYMADGSPASRLEANYRGARPFLGQAHAQAASRRLVVRDGWRYFVHGWTQALAPMVPGGVGRERVTLFETIANADRRGTQP